MTIQESLAGTSLGNILDFRDKRIENTPGVAKRVFTTSDSGTINLNFSEYTIFDITATGDVTLTISNAKDVNTNTLIFRQDGTGGHSLRFPSGTKWGTIWSNEVDESPSKTANEVTVYSVDAFNDGSDFLFDKIVGNTVFN